MFDGYMLLFFIIFYLKNIFFTINSMIRNKIILQFTFNYFNKNKLFEILEGYKNFLANTVQKQWEQFKLHLFCFSTKICYYLAFPFNLILTLHWLSRIRGSIVAWRNKQRISLPYEVVQAGFWGWVVTKISIPVSGTVGLSKYLVATAFTKPITFVFGSLNILGLGFLGKYFYTSGGDISILWDNMPARAASGVYQGFSRVGSFFSKVYNFFQDPWSFIWGKSKDVVPAEQQVSEETIPEFLLEPDLVESQIPNTQEAVVEPILNNSALDGFEKTKRLLTLEISSKVSSKYQNLRQVYSDFIDENNIKLLGGMTKFRIENGVEIFNEKCLPEYLRAFSEDPIKFIFKYSKKYRDLLETYNQTLLPNKKLVISINLEDINYKRITTLSGKDKKAFIKDLVAHWPETNILWDSRQVVSLKEGTVTHDLTYEVIAEVQTPKSGIAPQLEFYIRKLRKTVAALRSENQPSKLHFSLIIKNERDHWIATNKEEMPELWTAYNREKKELEALNEEANMINRDRNARRKAKEALQAIRMIEELKKQQDIIQNSLYHGRKLK